MKFNIWNGFTGVSSVGRNLDLNSFSYRICVKIFSSCRNRAMNSYKPGSKKLKNNQYQNH